MNHEIRIANIDTGNVILRRKVVLTCFDNLELVFSQHCRTGYIYCKLRTFTRSNRTDVVAGDAVIYRDIYTVNNMVSRISNSYFNWNTRTSC